MSVTRRSFLGSAAAFAVLADRLAAAAPLRGGSAAVAIEASGRATDYVMCRRLYLDICGRIPTRTEVERYTTSKDSHKMEKLVDKLLESEDYADYWAMRYCDILRVKSEFPINLWPNAVYVYHRRIRQAIANDEPWPDFARALLCARGSNFRVPESNFLRASATHTPEALSEAATMTFLLEPSRKYAKYFSRVEIKKTKEWKEEIVGLKLGPADEVPERFMDELEGPLASKFYAAPVKRVYYWIYDTMPRSTAETTLTGVFKRGGFRLRPLLRHVFLSSNYKAGPIRGKFPPRRLDAEVLDDAITSITGVPHAFTSIAPEPFTFLPPKRKSVLIEDGSITSSFLMLFGRPARDSGALEERHNEITAKQRLYLYNSNHIWKALGMLADDPKFKALDHRQQVDDLFLRFLARPATKEELAVIDPKNNLDARSIAWYLVNSFEFLFRV